MAEEHTKGHRKEQQVSWVPHDPRSSTERFLTICKLHIVPSKAFHRKHFISSSSYERFHPKGSIRKVASTAYRVLINEWGSLNEPNDETFFIQLSPVLSSSWIPAKPEQCSMSTRLTTRNPVNPTLRQRFREVLELYRFTHRKVSPANLLNLLKLINSPPFIGYIASINYLWSSVYSNRRFLHNHRLLCGRRLLVVN